MPRRDVQAESLLLEQMPAEHFRIRSRRDDADLGLTALQVLDDVVGEQYVVPLPLLDVRVLLRRPRQRHGRGAVRQRRRTRRRGRRRPHRGRRGDPVQRVRCRRRPGRRAEAADVLVVTDSNRLRAHHWRSSQDVTGYTEPGAGPATLWKDSGDARLDAVPGGRADGLHRVAVRTGRSRSGRPATASASPIYPRLARRWRSTVTPTRRGRCSIRARQYIEITTDVGDRPCHAAPAERVRDVRHLRTVTVTVDGGDPIDVDLDDRSLIAGQRVGFPATDGPATITRPARSGRRAGTGSGHGHPDRTPRRLRRDRRRPRRQPRGRIVVPTRPHRGDARRRHRAARHVRPHP